MDRRRVDPIIAAAPSASLTTNWLGSRIVSSPADQDAVVELDRVLVLRRRAVIALDLHGRSGESGGESPTFFSFSASASG